MIIQRNRLLLLLSIFVFTTSAATETVENYDSGKAKLVNIMANEDTGIAAYNKKNIKYAETQNIAHDLNIAQMAEALGCHTLMGKSFIEETLKNPVSVQDKNSVLLPRQNAIKALVENPDFKKEVEQFLKIAKEAEQEVIKLLSDFFKGKTCPELTNLELIQKQNPGLYPIFEFMTFNPTAKSVSTALNLLSVPASAYGMVKPGRVIDAYAKIFQVEQFPSAVYAFVAAYMGVATGASLYGAYKDYSTASEKRTKMHALNQLITVAEKIETLCADYGVKNQFNISEIKDADGLSLIEGLKHARYQDKNTKLFLTPSVHTFLYSLYQQKNHLAKVFACIAELDAYNALALQNSFIAQ